jgi:hypothetical protein
MKKETPLTPAVENILARARVISAEQHDNCVRCSHLDNALRESIPGAPELIEFRTVLQVTGGGIHESALTEFAVAHLKSRGYNIARPDAPWEKPGEFCGRVGIYGHKLHKLIERYSTLGGTPPAVVVAGKSARITALQSNPHFDNFCRSTGRRFRAS